MSRLVRLTLTTYFEIEEGVKINDGPEFAACAEAMERITGYKCDAVNMLLMDEDFVPSWGKANPRPFNRELMERIFGRAAE